MSAMSGSSWRDGRGCLAGWNLGSAMRTPVDEIGIWFLSASKAGSAVSFKAQSNVAGSRLSAVSMRCGLIWAVLSVSDTDETDWTHGGLRGKWQLHTCYSENISTS